MKITCALLGHAWGAGVQDEPSPGEAAMIADVMRFMKLESLVWSGGKWTYCCKRCGKQERR